MSARESLVQFLRRLVARRACARRGHPLMFVATLGERSSEYACPCGRNLDVRTF